MRRSADPLDRPFPISGIEAGQYGAITTFENAELKRLVLHRNGRVTDAVREACAIAVQLDTTFRVISVSTPTSIYTDLQGARKPSGNGYGHVGSHAVQTPEHRLVSGPIRHMLHPRLRGTAVDGWLDAEQ